MDSEKAHQHANEILPTLCHNATQRCPQLHTAFNIIMIAQLIRSGKQHTQLRAENVTKCSEISCFLLVGLS